MLEIHDLYASVCEKPILKGLNLHIKVGEIHAIMGPNGAGKSTLARIITGHPAYTVTKGEVLFEGQSILEMEPEERAKLGLFMSFQYPPEITGLTNSQFLYQALNARRTTPLSQEEFTTLLEEKMEIIKMRREFKDRSVNEGFSGGEKKSNEILQMALLEPKLAILDETDSGLDIDAMRIVAQGMKQIMNKERAMVLITHYQRLLEYIQPHFVHVFVDGKIVRSGDSQLALELEAQGYLDA
ncbi:MAG: Fe-S cluster assembly ATPase SufC [Chlamydiales bacterium]